ncbi:LysR family transcriptional regulator [Pseudomonas sp. M47T1]|uniref:LysR family transcriptional regulator n=1 Tax=unclassified Pseudomonas TaxID=196821 RepID=UPI0002607B5A|nr:LysR family transcriptional regulator [Pseudomonas sp. M47T1]EIK95551.1 LysR family transcriptional regulator [Pseudomonas sp. M47T1]
MNLKQIEYALAVAEEGSFTRAAERCHTVQSALSHQIARLERQLGAQLFERTSRRVALTPAGEAFVHSARTALAAARRISDDVAAACGQVRGRLGLGMISSLTGLDVVERIAAFHHQYTQVDVQLCVGRSEWLLEEVRGRRMDVALIGVWPGEPVQGVASRALADEELVAVMHPDHALAALAQVSLAQLADQALVDFAAGSGARRQTDEAFAAARVAHRVQFEVSDMRLVEQFVQRAMALGLVPASVARSFQAVVTVPVSDAPRRRLYAIWSNTPTPAARAFVAMLEQALADQAPKPPSMVRLAPVT